MAIDTLSKIGLTNGEIAIYETLLDIGESTRTKLAKKSGVSPSKIYDVANRLHEKGIISIVKKRGVLHFSAASPSRIRYYLDEKAKELAQEKKLVDRMLPKLIAKYNQHKDDVDVEVFYGWNGLKTAFLTLENSMHPKDESLVFGASIGKNPKQADIFFKQHQKRVAQRGYKIRIIFNEDVHTRKKRYQYYVGHKKHNIRFLHHETLTELHIYKKTVLILLLLEKPLAIAVRSSEAVRSFRSFFETMWKQARK